MEFNSASPFPEGVISFLDTDLYKLTMQCAVFKFFRDVPVSYLYTNRTPEKTLSRAAFRWLEEQINSKRTSVELAAMSSLTLTLPAELGNISLSPEEYRFLETHCSYFTEDYLEYLREFRLRPREQISIRFTPTGVDSGSDSDVGSIDIKIQGSWSDTILYEIPILALTSEAYFRFMDTDWNYDGQEDLAFDKGMRLLEAGCIVSEFGTRRRRDYHTQALVFRGLVKASKAAEAKGYPGKLSGTSNVHLAMRFGIPPVGTVAHEWFMGIAAIFDDYKKATELALGHWVGCFGSNLAIALTDTFGTPEFLKSFSLPVRTVEGGIPADAFKRADGTAKTYAELFTGVRQDSGDPAEYAKLMRNYYDQNGIKDKKVIVFSDSLNIERCLEYKKISEGLGFQPTFGVGTFLTNDFTHLKTGKNDNAGKNTGDKDLVERVKKELGYVERDWKDGDERCRWGKEERAQA
ncbi:hypothetical protein UVI_02018620 [Ustilaginoidea virens]|uniref:nicotinate phosphoribosyltransferase n=1 Tax=Ustilaginoidea virens TaxID=1159556 RepID=A0A1B5KUZ3_USTVR|nr:hypothetical protein UVI_02018620 [Ustilaginoidea virens]